MIDIIQEIENLKAYVVSQAATDPPLYLSNQTVHSWAPGTTVEDVIKQLEKLKNKIIEDQKENQGQSAAARMLRQTIDHSEIPSEYYTRLLEIANMIENEYSNAKENNISEIIPATVIPSCGNLVVYIKSYVESNGPCTERFIQGLYEFIDKIDTQMINLSSENKILRTENETLANRSQLLMRIHDILDHN